MTQRPTMQELFRVFARIGVLSFGGPAAQISLMHRELVEERPWLTEDQFLRALSLCMMLPGPEAMQLATYAGWRLKGVIGGLIGGVLFVLPGALVIAALALAYVRFGQTPLLQDAFLGIKAAVVVIVAQALLRLSRKALTGAVAWALAAGAFVAIFAFGIGFPLVIALAAVIGAVMLSPTGADAPETASAASLADTLRTVVLWGAIWTVPLLIALWLDPEFLGAVGLFFSKLAVVTFGGAYAVLAYMTQEVVSGYGWLTTAQMIDALGLAETTPGPLILVTQFVAMLAGDIAGGPGLALLAGALALWVTFVPCFLWIFAAAPFVEAITQRPRLNAALQGITAAVVGVIAQLGLWFALHVLFADIRQFGAIPVPDPASVNIAAAALVGVAALALLWRGLSVPSTLAILAVCGIAAGVLA